MGNNNSLDWKAQLRNIKTDMVANMTEEEKLQMKREEKQLKKEEEVKRNRKREYFKRQKSIYEFLAGYKHNSGIFINNFFRNRDFETYCQDKFHAFDFDVSGLCPVNFFDDFNLSMDMVNYLRELEERKIAYYPINESYIEHLVALSEAFDLLEPLEEDTILYRGCSTIERNGVYGVVSTTTNLKIAEQFSRGTILTIHAPKGTKNINIKSIRPKEQRKKDYENEILLPPCSYQIISEKQVKSGREPNNHSGITKKIEINIEELDLLEEFEKRMENPPEEYLPIQEIIKEDYELSLFLLKKYLYIRDNNSSLKRLLKRD